MPNKQPISHALASRFTKLIYLSRETYISMTQNLYTFYAIGIYLLQKGFWGTLLLRYSLMPQLFVCLAASPHMKAFMIV